MMYLISAVPGSGKTLRIVGKIKVMVAANAALIAQGLPPRRIFSNIKGLRIPSVEIAPEDWRDTPQNSIVIYDEAQEIFPATGSSGISKDERVVAMTTHRHSGHDLYFLTQDPIFLDATLRKLVGNHEHLWRASSLQAATVYTWDGHQSSPMSATALKLADEVLWTFPKGDYGDYLSASHHTHKFIWPKKILLLIVGFLVVASLTGWMIFGRDNSFSIFRQGLGVSEAAAAEQGAAAPGVVVERPPTGAETWQSAPKLVALSGCAILSRSCRAWDGEGAQLDLTKAECLNLCSGPMPLDFSAEKKRLDEMRTSAVAAVVKPETAFDGARFLPPDPLAQLP